MSTSTPEQPDAAAMGRRERKKQDTHRRIFQAADELFTRKGYAAVTTQEVADAADVGAGTLFRYARNKAELLIMVMNERLRLGAERGLVVAEAGGSPTDAVLALIDPLIQATIDQPENTAAFQREVLFGAAGPYRAEALRRIRELEDAITTILARHVGAPAAAVQRAAGTIFSVLYVRLIRLELGRTPPQALPDQLRRDIEYLVRKLLAP